MPADPHTRTHHHGDGAIRVTPLKDGSWYVSVTDARNHAAIIIPADAFTTLTAAVSKG
jgi:hypothetical protein